MMKMRKLEKDMIFYIPKKPGTVFTYKAGHFVDDNMIDEMRNHLTYDMETNVAWVEERRISQRPV